MSNLASAFQPAIDALEQEYADLERQANALLTSINVLRQRAGLPPRPGGFFDGHGSQAPAEHGRTGAIRSDAFVGKRMRAAVREFLQMRRDAGMDAPATTREILNGLKEGGFSSGAKDDATAMVVLGTMLRKGSDTFHRLDNGRWGLQAWYGTVRRRQRTAADQNSSQSEDSDLDSDETETAEARAGVSLMITQEQKEQLRQRGFSAEQIREMKPAEAHRVLGLAPNEETAVA